MITAETMYTNAVIGNDSRVLEDIHLETKNIAIYRREISSLKEEIDHLREESIEFRAEGTLSEITNSLDTFFGSQPVKYKVLPDDVLRLLKI